MSEAVRSSAAASASSPRRMCSQALMVVASATPDRPAAFAGVGDRGLELAFEQFLAVAQHEREESFHDDHARAALLGDE